MLILATELGKGDSIFIQWLSRRRRKQAPLEFGDEDVNVYLVGHCSGAVVIARRMPSTGIVEYVDWRTILQDLQLLFAI